MSPRDLQETRVVRVIDGDTLVVEHAFDRAGQRQNGKTNKGAHIRFDGVDAPEIKHSKRALDQPGGPAAFELITKLAPPNARIWLGVKRGNDRFHRTVADLWAEQPDGRLVWLQEALLMTGAAWRLTDYDDKNERWRNAHLSQLFNQAFEAHLALFACRVPMNPHVWRHTPEARLGEIAAAATRCSETK